MSNTSLTGTAIRKWLMVAKSVIDARQPDYTTLEVAREGYKWVESLWSGYDVVQGVVDELQAELAAANARIARLEAVYKAAAYYCEGIGDLEDVYLAVRKFETLESGAGGGEVERD